jgi:hypothetical protein
LPQETVSCFTLGIGYLMKERAPMLTKPSEPRNAPHCPNCPTCDGQVFDDNRNHRPCGGR